ncbi:hypothetical protein SARC_10987 [Sphaeroforma arctica JP610]|uniref:Uncharacterized protein n=1 Tax=Sphaeroforma arctica JP610 TaxID=667725 RepID=A0A0L0FID6_9EUKA|nr:hypothetical protein SARC_10987 [Sphaeroforma arctica JP610]KNC76515.1 hypothetical protein SARC_10987 [Sphaeroforma arctica JP610]|eukprot:XP_014150417.1 hypothetical protein SARC_10987 [Sphaeroforma arctica JP610]
MITLDKSGLSKDGPFRPLTYGQAASGGRSSQTGRITVRHRQGRAQRTLVRTVDFIRSARLDIPATIVRVEHDPSRTGLLALVKYAKEKPVSTTVRADGTDMDGLPPGFWGHLYDPDELVDDVLNDVTQKLTSEEEETPEDLTDSVDPEAEAVDETPATAVIAKGRAAIAIGRAKSEAKMYKDYAYILCPQGVAPGMKLVSSRSTSVPVLPGNACLIKYMRAGSVIHNVELKPGRGGQLIRSAGSWGTILGKDEEKGFAVVRITSKTQMRVRLDCMATYGKVSNPEHHNEAIGSAGRNRRLGRRPKVRGIAMNPCDHPHGGKGTGKVNDMTRWGKRGKGWKTVRNLKRKKGGIHGNIIWRHIANKKQAGQVKQ